MPASATFEPGVPFAAVGAGDAMAGNGAPAPGALNAPTGGPASAGPKPGKASLWADLPLDAPNDLPGWFVAIGGAIAAFSFLLPWAARGRTLIGDTTLELNPGYIDSWGLAVPTSVLLVGLALALFALAVWPNRIPRWIACGILPILGGGLFAGIAWTYASASSAFGGGVGLSALLLGAGFLVAGGVLEVRPRRHEPPQSGV
ncbi:MAG: hypothetical protein E6I45_03700 [Chloroflexi bacterium]|nr:MAG: hypothetical protein E6I45_03700 [Chloroflexota bacterium]